MSVESSGKQRSDEAYSCDGQSVCSSVPSTRNSQRRSVHVTSSTSSRRTVRSRRRLTFNLNRFSLRELFYNSVGRRFRCNNDRRVRVSFRDNAISSACDGSSLSDTSSHKGVKASLSDNVEHTPGQLTTLSGLVTGDIPHADSVSGKSHLGDTETRKDIECPLCLLEKPSDSFPLISTCHHRCCINCLQQYLSIEITESRVNISCPVCTEALHPSDIRYLLENVAHCETLMSKYQDFMVRRVLLHTEPDTRWCPAPDCNYAVIASGCASCPKLKCERPGCDTRFCYHCKQEWHANQTCDAARAERSPNMYSIFHHHGNIPRSSSVSFSQGSNAGVLRDDIKPCPRCQVLIVKMDDGSCNHMTCLICSSEFCWLCMKEISDLHYLSPSGCTFWGKKPWSRKKKILWQLGTLVGAPIGIGLIAGIAIPAMIIGIPVWVGRKIHNKYKSSNRLKRNCAITGAVVASVLVSPLIAGVAVSIGVPVLLAYIYGVVPVSLCRSGGCGVSTSRSGGVKIEFDDENDVSGLSVGGQTTDGQHLDSVSVSQQSGSQPLHYRSSIGAPTNPSIGEASLQACSVSASISFGGESQIERTSNTVKEEQEEMLREADVESSSNRALAGSIASYVTASVTQNKLDVCQGDVSSNKRFSMSSASLSERSNTMSMANDDACSTKALAGSIVGYRETQAYNTPAEVHVDAQLDLTMCPTSPSLVNTSTQTMCLTDVSVNPPVVGTSKPVDCSRQQTDKVSFDDSSPPSSATSEKQTMNSSDVGVQVELRSIENRSEQNNHAELDDCDKKM